jgi:hypothetical protein
LYSIPALSPPSLTFVSSLPFLSHLLTPSQVLPPAHVHAPPLRGHGPLRRHAARDSAAVLAPADEGRCAGCVCSWLCAASHSLVLSTGRDGPRGWDPGSARCTWMQVAPTIACTTPSWIG